MKDIAKKEFEIELKDGTQTKIEIPKKVPSVLGMNTRDKIEIGFQGDSKRGQVEVENVQQVVNQAQKYLIENILSNHTDYNWNQITLETHDKLWDYYKDQINGKKKEDTDKKSDNTSSTQAKASEESKSESQN